MAEKVPGAALLHPLLKEDTVPRAARSALPIHRSTASILRRLPRPVVGLVLLLTLAGCAVSPTGRRQMILMSPYEMSQMGQTATSSTRTSTIDDPRMWPAS